MKKKLTAAAVLLAMAVSFGAGFAAEARPAPKDEKKVERRQPPPDRKPAPRPAPAPGPRPAPRPAPRPEPRPAPAPRPGPAPRPQPAPGPRPAPAPRPAPPRPAPPPKPHHRSMHGSDYLKGILGILGAVAAGSSSESYDESYESTAESTSSDAYYSAIYAEEVLALCNAERAKVGAPPLRLDSHLQRVAGYRADEIVERFSHTRRNGEDVNWWFFSSDPHAEENLAGGYESPQEVVAGWMADAARRAIILDPANKEMGLGFHEDERGMYRYYWVQLLWG